MFVRFGEVEALASSSGPQTRAVKEDMEDDKKKGDQDVVQGLSAWDRPLSSADLSDKNLD